MRKGLQFSITLCLLIAVFAVLYALGDSLNPSEATKAKSYVDVDLTELPNGVYYELQCG